MKSQSIIIETDGPIANVILNRPDSYNSMNKSMRMELGSAINSINQNPDIRVAVIKGAGKGFCAGADLAEGVGDAVDKMLLEEYQPFLAAIAESPKPFIAQVHGPAAGIGGALAMVCDQVVMSEDAYLYLAFAAIGLIPDGGLNWHLIHALGYRRAYEAIVEGRKIPAPECLEVGITNKVVPVIELESTVAEKAKRIAAGAPLAQAAAKQLLRQAERMTMREVIEMEANMQKPLTESNDCQNAIDAFFAKQKPVFKGT